jgi:hypothetical protein
MQLRYRQRFHILHLLSNGEGVPGSRVYSTTYIAEPATTVSTSPKISATEDGLCASHPQFFLSLDILGALTSAMVLMPSMMWLYGFRQPLICILLQTKALQSLLFGIILPIF